MIKMRKLEKRGGEPLTKLKKNKAYYFSMKTNWQKAFSRRKAMPIFFKILWIWIFLFFFLLTLWIQNVNLDTNLMNVIKVASRWFGWPILLNLVYRVRWWLFFHLMQLHSDNCFVWFVRHFSLLLYFIKSTVSTFKSLQSLNFIPTYLNNVEPLPNFFTSTTHFEPKR